MIMEGGVVIENIILEKDGIEFGKMIYQANMQSVDLKFLAYFWIVSNQAYVLTLTCEESEYDNYVEEGTKIMESFKILEKNKLEKEYPAQEKYTKEFDWTITIPEGLEPVSAEDWSLRQNKGMDLVEKEVEMEVENNTTTVFVFKKGDLNTMEVLRQSIQEAYPGVDYDEASNEIHSILYDTFVNQLEGVKVDTLTTTQKIDGLEFKRFDIDVLYPNELELKVIMFSRLFDETEFVFNIMYIDEKLGKEMLDAFLNSTFGKK